jgi:Tfp pilus assembly protein PilO
MGIKKKYLNSIQVAIAAALISVLAVILVILSINGQKHTVLTQKAELQKLTGDLTNLDTILSDEKKYVEVIKKISATLPKEYSDIATAVSAIELTAKTNNLITDLSIDAAPKPEIGDFKSLTIAIKTTGTYTDIRKFAGDVSKLPYHTHVDSLTFDESGGKIAATMTIRLFIQ